MSATVDSVIDRVGGTGAVAAGLGVPLSTVSTWRARGSIPASRWADIVRFAAGAGFPEITFEVLAGTQALAPIADRAEARQ